MLLLERYKLIADMLVRVIKGLLSKQENIAMNKKKIGKFY